MTCNNLTDGWILGRHKAAPRHRPVMASLPKPDLEQRKTVVPSFSRGDGSEGSIWLHDKLPSRLPGHPQLYLYPVVWASNLTSMEQLMVQGLLKQEATLFKCMRPKRTAFLVCEQELYDKAHQSGTTDPPDMIESAASAELAGPSKDRDVKDWATYAMFVGMPLPITDRDRSYCFNQNGHSEKVTAPGMLSAPSVAIASSGDDRAYADAQLDLELLGLVDVAAAVDAVVGFECSGVTVVGTSGGCEVNQEPLCCALWDSVPYVEHHSCVAAFLAAHSIFAMKYSVLRAACLSTSLAEQQLWCIVELEDRHDLPEDIERGPRG
ncbi:uncharacterized protein EDB91DRAFT_1084768 [Suillus paluster]|uniref:uncharacterized protein n=1 Tax=Suillus paluster TaxID=48578 RepID=UPI001B865F79|nr:uncharacterized protein EDB91DRAFT_1084768 [Suillus paluster]KAG1732437.1 hypothetical protein EDB91DRAFT_1084768 [Suillus paluster]